MKLILSRIANSKGQAATVLNLFLAVIAVIIIAGLGFEMSRYFLARDQLKTNTEAAALCAETSLVSSGDPANATNQQNAVATALTLFQQNSILGQSMASAASESSVSGLSPAAGQAEICFEFLNPVTRLPIAGAGSATGALIRATGAFCYTPVLSQWLGLGNAQFTFQVSAYSGVPSIDVVLAFDVSGAMDDETPITPIQRFGGTTGGTTGGQTTGGQTTGGQTTGGGGGCVRSNGLNYLYPMGVNNQPALGNTLTATFGSPGLSNTGLPNATPPQYLENSVNYPGTMTFAEQSGAPTLNLTGYNGNTGTAAYMGVVPGDTCLNCPQTTTTTGGITTGGTTTGGTTGSQTTGTQTTGTQTTGTQTTGTQTTGTQTTGTQTTGTQTTGTQTTGTQTTGTQTTGTQTTGTQTTGPQTTGLQTTGTQTTGTRTTGLPGGTLFEDNSFPHRQKSNMVASIKPSANEDLQRLCAELDLVSSGKKIKKQFDFNKSTNTLSTLYFAPLFAAYPSMGNPSNAATANSSSTASSSSSSTVTTNGGIGATQVAPFLYNGFYYTGASSHVPGTAPAYSPASPPIPGNCPGGFGPSPVVGGPPAPNVFTDLAVNIDGNNSFWGNYTDSNSYLFTDPGTLVEAARGNLDTNTAATNAFVDFNAMNISPTPQYDSAYYNDAQYVLQPLNDLLYAASSLVKEMTNVADAHFSFIAFNDTAGNAATGVTPAQYSTTQQAGYIPMISSWFPYLAPAPTNSGAAIFILPPLPFVALDPSPTGANSDVMTQIPVICPNGNRNVSAVLQAAINQLTTNGRPGANQAIILFCDGVPTEANQSNSAALTDAINAIQKANTKIPIYCVCVADPNSTSNPSDDSVDDTAYGTSNGITAISGPGSGGGPKYYRVDWTNANGTQSNLSTVVDNIVRQMVGMMH